MRSIERGAIVVAFAGFAAIFSGGASAFAAGIPAGSATLTPSAISLPAQPVCDQGTVCMWDEPNYTASNEYGSEESEPVGSGYCWQTDIGDGYQSIINSSSQYQRAWTGSDCTGEDVLVAPDSSISDLGFVAYGTGGY
jgi:hypothetical protein